MYVARQYPVPGGPAETRSAKFMFFGRGVLKQKISFETSFKSLGSLFTEIWATRGHLYIEIRF